jgi:hypothetical protein
MRFTDRAGSQAARPHTEGGGDSASAPHPRDGDVVVVCEARPAAGCTVRQWPAAVQLRMGSRDAALHLARNFARTHAVNLWCGERDSMRLLEVYRPRDAHRRASTR